MNQMQYNLFWLQPVVYGPSFVCLDYLNPQDIFNNFCLCDLDQPVKEVKEVELTSDSTVPEKGSRKIHSLESLSDYVVKLHKRLDRLTGTSLPFVTGKKKCQASKNKSVSKRRSRFIGVTHNSANYQALIMINGKKTYVDTFAEELLAAITFDFYSMLLHGVKATTNFTYSAEEVKEMLRSFEMYDHVFRPHSFAESKRQLVQ